MKRFLFIFLAFFSLLFIFSSNIKAEGEFLTDTNAEYKVQENGKTTVTQTVTIENVLSNIYATSYSLVLDNIDPVNPRAFEGGKPLTLSTHKDQDKTTLNVTFDNAVVGKGKTRTFNVLFEDTTFATRTGEVWEVSIPKLGDTSFRSYSITLAIPDSFGEEAYISPKPTDFIKAGGERRYLFGKESILKSPITAGFGAFQVFAFNLNYHLENPLAQSASIDIAIPPDTSLQRLYYQNIDPAPENVRIDADGNWLARYILKPRERIDVKVGGNVQIFAGPRPFLPPSQQTLITNLKTSKYWQVDNLSIAEIAKRLKTPRAIYDFVTQTLSYDYGRVKPNVSRLGALEALTNPKNAICMEFTDLFIALARAAGIPAREINGFAYTENPKIQPLSLVADVLHAWPEYWDQEKKTWVAVDPTWGSTTGGVDYFNKLDLRHFTFVIHGADPEKPYPPGSYKLGANPQKDVFVSFGQLPEKKESVPQITLNSLKTIPFLFSSLAVTIKNPGPVALYNLAPVVYFDDKVNKNSEIAVLPPFSSQIIETSVPFSFLAKATPSKVRVSVEGSDFEISTFKNQVLLYNLLALFLAFLIVLTTILIRLRKVNIREIWQRIRHGKTINQPPQDPDSKGQV